MRKSSKSMLQPSKPNASTVNPNKFGNTIEGVGFNKSSLQPSVRKVEGQDFSKTAKSNFEQTVSNLKNKPNQKVLEDEYIKGLQEQIKYLEYELKLLKDKQILEREGVNELDNFLKDEIPINENILAMKNKYNATKAKLQEQFQLLSSKKAEAGDVLRTQKNQINRLHQIIDAHRLQTNERKFQFKNKLSQLMKQITLTNDEYATLTKDNEELRKKIKRMNEEIADIQRDQEKQKISEVKSQEQRTKKAELFQEKFKFTKENMIEYTQKEQELLELEEDKNPLADALEEQNSYLRKRLMLNEKQRSTAENTKAEIELFLREQEKQREIERNQKNKLLIAGEESRLELQRIERFSDTIIKDATLRTKKVMLKEMSNELSNKEEIYDLLSERLKDLEAQCSELIQNKKQFNDALDGLIFEEKQIDQDIAAKENDITKDKCSINSNIKLTEVIQKDIEPLVKEIDYNKKTIPDLQKQIETKNTKIHYLNKQIELLKELKNLDLEHLTMISQGGSQMQNVLGSFIKNWENIKRM